MKKKKKKKLGICRIGRGHEEPPYLRIPYSEHLISAGRILLVPPMEFTETPKDLWSPFVRALPNFAFQHPPFLASTSDPTSFLQTSRNSSNEVSRTAIECSTGETVEVNGAQDDWTNQDAWVVQSTHVGYLPEKLDRRIAKFFSHSGRNFPKLQLRTLSQLLCITRPKRG